MRTALLLSLMLIRPIDGAAQATPAAPGRAAQTPPPATGGAAQTPPPATGGTAQTPPPATGRSGQTPPATPPATGRSGQTQPAGRATQPAAGRSGIAMTVTDMKGATLDGVSVELSGPATRRGETATGGQLNFPGLPAGTYRLRFSGEEVTAFEREVTLPAGKPTVIDVALSAAPPPKEIIKPAPAPAAPVATAPVGPPGQPQILSLVDLAEKELERKQPRRETLVSCSGNTRSTLLQLNSDQPERLYENAETLFYVIAGEGVLRIDGKDTRLVAGGFASVPRATSFTIGRRQRNPLILLAVLSGEPCEEAR